MEEIALFKIELEADELFKAMEKTAENNENKIISSSDVARYIIETSNLPKIYECLERNFPDLEIKKLENGLSRSIGVQIDYLKFNDDYKDKFEPVERTSTTGARCWRLLI